MSAEFSPGASVAMTASFEGGVAVGPQVSINSLSAPVSLESVVPSGLSFTPGIESGSQVFGQVGESLPFSSSSDEAVASRIGELAGELGLPQFAQSAESVLAQRGLSLPASEVTDAQDGNSQLEGVVEDGALLGDSKEESLLGASDEGTEQDGLVAQEDTFAESPDNESAKEAVDEGVSETDTQESADESEDTDTRESAENSDEPEKTDETKDESEEEEQDDDQQERKRKLDNDDEEDEEKKKKRPPQEEAGPVVDTSANERRLGLLAEEIIRDATENGGEVSTQRVGQRFVTRVQGDRAAQSGIIFEMSTGTTDKTPEWVAASMQTTGTTSVENAFTKAQAAVANNTAVAIGPHANVGDREVAKVGVPPELVGAQLRQRHASLTPAQIA